jgi:hypothetical protein
LTPFVAATKGGKMKKIIWLGALVLLFAELSPIAGAASDLKTVKMVVPRGTAFVLSYFGARDAGIFRKHGIDVQVDSRPFAGFIAALSGDGDRVAKNLILTRRKNYGHHIYWRLSLRRGALRMFRRRLVYG